MTSNIELCKTGVMSDMMSGSESAGDVSCGGPKADMRGVTTGRPLRT